MDNLTEILEITDDLTDEELDSLVQELTKRYLERMQQNMAAEGKKLAVRLEQLRLN